jgi:hypothetical protein
MRVVIASEAKQSHGDCFASLAMTLFRVGDVTIKDDKGG